MNRWEDCMKVARGRFGGTCSPELALVVLVMGQASAPPAQEPQTKGQRPPAKAQTSAARAADQGRPGC